MQDMSIEKIEAEALKLKPKERARLAGKLLESLEDLSDEESARIWGEEAQRRDAEWDVHEGSGSRPVRDVLRDARTKLKRQGLCLRRAAPRGEADRLRTARGGPAGPAAGAPAGACAACWGA